MRDHVTTETVAGSFMQRLERQANDQGHAWARNLEGRLLAPDSGGLNFRLNTDRAGETFATYVELFDGMTAPVALVWPMRHTGGIATSHAQSRYLAIYVRLATGDRWATLDYDKPRIEWQPATSPRVAELKRCLAACRQEGGMP